MALTSEAQPLDLSRIAQDLQMRKVQVEAAVHLLDEGNTPSFIARYRQEASQGLDEDRIRLIRDRITDQRALADRKSTILKAIEAQGKLTDDLRQAIGAAETAKRLEDLFLPFKPKKKSAASEAREKGLEELANAIMASDPAVANLPEILAGMINPDKGLNTSEDVLAGVKLILVETLAESAAVRAPVRFALWDTGRLVSRKVVVAEPEAPPAPTAPVEAAPTTEGTPAPAPDAAAAPEPPKGRPRREHKNDDRKADEYRDYFDFTEGLRDIPPHRILAVNRGEKEHVLQAQLAWDEGRVRGAAASELNLAEHPHKELLEPLLGDALVQYVLPSLEKEIRKELMEEALTHAIEIFARNFRSLLLTPPLKNTRVLAIDPGMKSGSKAVALDEMGMVIGHESANPLPPQNKIAEAKATFANLIRQHNLKVIAIGNGQMCRDMEAIVSELIDELEAPADGQPAVPGITYAIANEAGAADYSDSPAAREEFPNLDRMTRGTISIGRRLQDPLAELVKIDPQHVGVGLYQHDIKPKHLKESIDEVIEACVNEVGVDVNRAGVSLLRYVSGLSPVIAQAIVQYRTENGPFRTRSALLKVPGLIESRFLQAAAFLKVRDGDDPLDGTWVHPESYALARQILAEAGFIDADLRDIEKLPRIKAKLAEISPADAATRYGTSEGNIRGLLQALAEPYYDPRDARTPPVLKRRMLRLEDLHAGMELKGTIVNVVPFGAFVDIGLKDTGLIHISRMANRFIKNPYEVVGVGDVVTVWVAEVDQERKRASLTMVQPGQERKPEPRPAFSAPPPRQPRQDNRPPRQPRQDNRPPRPDGPRPPRGDRPPQQQQQQQPRQPRPPRTDRPAGPGPGPRPPQGDRNSRFQRPPQQHRPMAEGAPSGPPADSGPPRKPSKPKVLPKLSKDALQGKSPLGSFAELEAFFKTSKDEPATPPTPPETPKAE